MIRTRSAADIRAWPSTPRIATSGSPGRIRRTTEVMSEAASSVRAAYAARRPRYFLTRATPGSGLRHPDRVPPHDVVDSEVRRRVLAVHPVVPGVVDLLVRHGDQRRILLENALGFANQRSALAVLELPLDLTGNVVEAGVGPPRVVLGAVFAIPRAEDVGGVHERGDDRADGEVEVAGRRLVEPHRRLYDTEVALDVEVLLQHGLDGHRPELEGRDVAHDEIEVPDAVRVSRFFHQPPSFLHSRFYVLLVAELLFELRARRRHLVEGIDEAAHLHRRRVLHHLDERMAIHGEVDRPAHARIGQGLVLLHVRPEGLNDRLVEGRRRHALHL